MITPSKIRYICFDVDGVLVRNNEYFSVQYAREVGIADDTMGPFFKEVFPDCCRGKSDLKEAVRPYLGEWKWEGTPDGFLQRWFKSEHNVDEVALQYVQDLQVRGIYCVVSSDNEKYRAQYVKENMGFGKVFQNMYFSYAVGYKKTDSEFWEFVYRDMSKENKLDKKEVLVVDDDEEVVKTAEQFGFIGYHYTEFYRFKENMLKYL